MFGDDDKIKVWTDGSCSLREGGTGGWAFYVEYGTKHASRYGYAENTTVNIMELTAILRALQFIRLTPPTPLWVFTDSQYARRSIVEWPQLWERRNWKNAVGDPIRNADLIKELLSWFKTHQKSRIIQIKWIRGHHGHFNNNRVDAMAGMARQLKKTNWRW